MKISDLKNKTNTFLCITFALTLFLVTVSAMNAQNKPEKSKLSVGKDLTILKIDGAKKKVTGGKTITIPSGHHELTFEIGGLKNVVMSFDFEPGKSYEMIGKIEKEEDGGRTFVRPKVDIILVK